MFSSRRLVAMTAVLVGIAAWGAASPALDAQSDTVIIELSFRTAAGPPETGVAVLDVNTGIEYRNAAVSLGDAIEVDGATGVTSELQVRRTDLRPASVSCEGADAPSVSGSLIVVTPGASGAICTVTLSADVPASGGDEELAVTGPSLELALRGTIVLGLGATLVGASRNPRD